MTRILSLISNLCQEGKDSSTDSCNESGILVVSDDSSRVFRDAGRGCRRGRIGGRRGRGRRSSSRGTRGSGGASRVIRQLSHTNTTAEIVGEFDDG